MFACTNAERHGLELLPHMPMLTTMDQGVEPPKPCMWLNSSTRQDRPRILWGHACSLPNTPLTLETIAACTKKRLPSGVNVDNTWRKYAMGRPPSIMTCAQPSMSSLQNNHNVPRPNPMANNRESLRCTNHDAMGNHVQVLAMLSDRVAYSEDIRVHPRGTHIPKPPRVQRLFTVQRPCLPSTCVALVANVTPCIPCAI